MDGAAATPQIRRGGSIASIVSSATATFKGCATADRDPRTAGPTAARHAAAPGRLPRARVTRRYSPDAIDGGSGDCRRRPVIVRFVPRNTREWTGAVEVTRSAAESCEIHFL